MKEKELKTKKMLKISLTIILISMCFQNSVAQNYNEEHIERILVSYFIQENIISCQKISDLVGKIKPNIELIAEDNFYNLSLYNFEFGHNSFEQDSSNVDNCVFHTSNCLQYMIIYNQKEKISYRIKGFNGNDFLFLIRDLKVESSRKIKNKELVESLFPLVDNLDLNCIYHSLLKRNWDSECLKVCNKPIAAH